MNRGKRTTRQLFEQIAPDYKLDPWGSAMSAFFDVAEIIYDLVGKCPPRWQYAPGAFPGISEENEAYTYHLRNVSVKRLMKLGNFLYWLTTILKWAGKDY